jgi:hypothetical protein
MNSPQSQVSLSQPGIIGPIRLGFNVVANHLSLLLLPVLLDLWIWLGVHFTLKKQMQDWIGQLENLFTLPAAQLTDLSELFSQVFVERLNIMIALRSFPVGVSSLMSAISPVETPLGSPKSIDLGSLAIGLGWFTALSIVGLALGTLYYLVVSQAALEANPKWLAAIKTWPWAFKQVFGLTFVWIGIVLAVSIPFICVIPILTMGSISQFLGFLYLALLAWLFFPLLLSAHGIFVNRDRMIVSLKKSVHISRLTLPTTTVFLLFVLFISQGLSVVWGWPSENSWILVIGMAGHSFVTTGLLAASFLYYREADQWAQKFLRQAMLRQYS